MRIHLYAVVSGFEALIASQLEPEAFGLHMAVGTKKLTSGLITFLEVEPSFRHERFPLLDRIEEVCVLHSDGRPRASKYVSVYRVLEFIPLDAFRQLHLATVDGRVLSLDAAPPRPEAEAADDSGPSLFQELCPLTPLVVSALGPTAFARHMTDPRNPISAPRLFFADLRLGRDGDGRLAGDLPYPNPAHLLECLGQVERAGGKPTKTVSRNPTTQGFFRSLRRGFFLADATGVKQYPFPTREHLEVHHAWWWHSAASH
jgi:hypothetical protein